MTYASTTFTPARGMLHALAYLRSTDERLQRTHSLPSSPPRADVRPGVNACGGVGGMGAPRGWCCWRWLVGGFVANYVFTVA